MKLVYADPPYFGCCSMYDHFHNEGGDLPWDGRCWNDRETHLILMEWVTRNSDGFAYSCNPADLQWMAPFGRVASWQKTWHQIYPTTVQYSWEPVIFKPARDDSKRKPMVRDSYFSSIGRGTGTKGGKPDGFNDWLLDMLVYEEGDEFRDLFPGSRSMQRALDRFDQRLRGQPLSSPVKEGL